MAFFSLPTLAALLPKDKIVVVPPASPPAISTRSNAVSPSHSKLPCCTLSAILEPPAIAPEALAARNKPTATVPTPPVATVRASPPKPVTNPMPLNQFRTLPKVDSPSLCSCLR